MVAQGCTNCPHPVEQELAPLTKRIKIGVIGDPHVDIRGEDGWRLGASSVSGLTTTVAVLNEKEPDLVLVPGDLLADGEQENLDRAKAVLDRLHCPYLVVSGNHDYIPADRSRLRRGFNYLSSAEFVGAFTGHGYDDTGKLYWSQKMSAAGLRVIGLDGCLREEKIGWGGVLPQQQLAFLAHELQQATRRCIVMVHHSLLHWGDDGNSQKGRWYSLDNSADVRRILEKYRHKVAMVISGHRHIGLRFQCRNGVPYFVVPSINTYPLRYVMLTLDAEGIGWRTFPVSVAEGCHEKARLGLLASSSFAGLDEQQKKKLLLFYENSAQRTGFHPW
ncbi:3',5'-cyclic AMP phosphodiesterase CpdA [Desulforhopalus singaporensis]|uniref:3',5'-cyclic AMP phosphodiesterase CpdA n=2 Tax=Desulforhopalus singaporensis TaxID=91360 RepID=A0A1H0RTF8_9BACT|nr:3',5'-cyclic AMP phosphodiesterase CpdA [Desulforhopalus singaporensis]